ncbi:MAG: hypothetical protein IKC26_07535 [Clostridia bacterium]|nr:hypothetical protein [Clostridia bacterium]
MRILKIILTVMLAGLLLALSLSSCNSSSSAGGGEGSSEESTGRPVVLLPEDTAPTIVPSASLDSVEDIETVGIMGNGIILEAECSRGKGVFYDGLNANGKRLWKPSPAEDWAVNPNVAIPDGFPTLSAPVGTEITVYNHTDYDVSDDYYMNFSSGETCAPDELPEEAGVYIRVVTFDIPRPSATDQEPEIGDFFGEYLYFVVISFE